MPMTKRTKILVIVLSLLAVLALVLYPRLKPTPVDTSIPEDSEVDSVTASLWGLPTGDPDVPEFAVQPQHIPEIMKKFRPAEQRSYPRWKNIGQLTIRRKDGRTTVIRFPGPVAGALCFTVNGIQHVRGEAMFWEHKGEKLYYDESMRLMCAIQESYQ